MAKQTIQQLHTEIGVNGNFMKILASRDGSTTDNLLVSGGAKYPGRVRWGIVTQSGSVTAQVAEIDAFMAAAGTS